MLQTLPETQSPHSEQVTRQRRWGAFAVSACVHAIVLTALAFVIIQQTQPSQSVQFETDWNELEHSPDLKIEAMDTPIAPADSSMISPDAGGTSLGIEFEPSQIASIGDGLSVDIAISDEAGRGIYRSVPSQKSPGSAANARKGSTKTGKGRGQGEGDGTGNGKGPGFFGAVPKGRRIVYVVDNSRSMNAKHDSPAKTRFRRLKEELIKAILELPRESEFYVIFFADSTLAMPARTLQTATPEAKEHYLCWVAQVDSAGGPTDPREAMQIGLALQPDVIYFLTDGEFKKGYSLTLRSIRQSRTAIHTFAFGEAFAEETLRAIAENNGGEYKFVP